MNDWKAMYQEKRKTPEEVAKLFHAGDICLSNGQITEPIAILHALADRAEREGLTGIRHYLLLPMRNQKYMAAGMEAHIRHVSHFVSGFDREAIWEGRSDYLPSHYSQVPVLWKQVLEGPDVFYCTVSPMDRHGYFSCGTAADLSEIRKKAKRLFLEVNPTMPRTFGSHIHISEVDALVESDLPITEVPPAPISKDDQIIGGMIAQEICDGATLQLGIGGIPNAVAQALMDKRDLGIHSEMFCDSIVDLTNAGVITNDRKKIHRGKTIVTFTFGARSTYDFIDDNPGVEFLPVDYVNDPFVIAQNDTSSPSTPAWRSTCSVRSARRPSGRRTSAGPADRWTSSVEPRRPRGASPFWPSSPRPRTTPSPRSSPSSRRAPASPPPGTTWITSSPSRAWSA